MTQDLFSLAGRTACVTGASSGIGQSIATALVRAGAAVVGVARREAQLNDWVGDAQALGGSAAPHAADLSDLPGMAALAQQVSSVFGPPDILVNAAGLNPRKPADTVTAEEWQQTIDLNLTAPFLLAQALVPAMRGTDHQHRLAAVDPGIPERHRLRRIERRRRATDPRHGRGLVRRRRDLQCPGARVLSDRTDRPRFCRCRDVGPQRCANLHRAQRAP